VENGPFIDDFPSKKKLHLSGIFHMLKDQMENIYGKSLISIWKMEHILLMEN